MAPGPARQPMPGAARPPGRRPGANADSAAKPDPGSSPPPAPGPNPRPARLKKSIARADRWPGALWRWLDAAPWRPWAALILLCLALFLPGLAALPVTDRDEARFAQASRQMLQGGDFIDIRFQDQPRWKKPAGIYWLQAGAVAGVSALTGLAPERVGIWAYRLPSVLGASLAVLGAFWGLAPLLGRRAALMAAAMIATSALVAAEANIAKTDAALLGAATIAMGAYLRLWLGLPGRWHLAMWAALAAGAMLKGPIVLLAPGGCVAWLCVAGRSLAPLKAMTWRAGPLLFLALTLPWYLAIHLKTGGAFFEEALVKDLLGKVAAGKEAHGAPPGTYLAILWAIFWPWAGLLIPAAPVLWRARARPEMLFLAGWAAPVWLVFELTPTKLPHYVLPALPALAGMLAVWLDGGAAVAGRRAVRIAAALFAAVGLALGLAAIGLPAVLEGAPSPGATLLALPGLAAVGVATLALWRGRIAAFGALAGMGAALLIAATLQFALPALKTAFPSPRMAEAAAPFAACAGRQAASVSFREPSLVFSQGTGTRFLSHGDAAALLRSAPGALVWVEDRRRDRLDAALGAGPPELRELARVEAFNLNRGKFTTLRLLARADDPTWASCAAAH